MKREREGPEEVQRARMVRWNCGKREKKEQEEGKNRTMRGRRQKEEVKWPAVHFKSVSSLRFGGSHTDSELPVSR